MKIKSSLYKVASLVILLTSWQLLLSCDKSGTDFSVLPETQSFRQAADSLNNQIDILWVVDNSFSMDPFQKNLVNNFGAFISNFEKLGYDFHMAVTTSDAYLANPLQKNKPDLAKFVDGTTIGGHSGYFILDSHTPNLAATFVQNALQGTTGSGDERAFSSFREALNSSKNAGFLRPGAFLSVIILSDEDDFSGNALKEYGEPDHDYTAATLEPVTTYVSELDRLTGSSVERRRYNVSAITVLDSSCLAKHSLDSTTTIIGKRYKELATATQGNLGDICASSFADSLTAIQNHISELSTQFYLSRIPDLLTLTVNVNGLLIQQDQSNGWTYDKGANSIVFHGNAIPPEKAQIQINFVPEKITN